MTSELDIRALCLARLPSIVVEIYDALMCALMPWFSLSFVPPSHIGHHANAAGECALAGLFAKRT